MSNSHKSPSCLAAQATAAIFLLLTPAITSPAFADWGATDTISQASHASAARPAPQATPAPSVLAQPPAAPPLAVTGANGGQFDAGVVNLNAAAATIKHTFTLRNTTPQSVTISRIHPSCGCVSVSVAGQNLAGQANTQARPMQDWKPVVLAPGQSLPIAVIVDAAQLPPGSLSKSVFVYTDGRNMPSAVLTITGEATTGVNASPAMIDLGSVKSGSARATAFTLTENSSALGGKAVAVRASSPAIVITGPVEKSGPIRTYRVSLAPNASLGMLSEAISVTDATGKKTFATIPVVGSVTGPLQASVDEIVFGAVPAGRMSEQVVTLSGPASASVLSATSSNPAVTVSVTGDRLHALLSPKAASGVLNGIVTVKTAGGTKLVLPVVADVVAGR